MTKLGKLLEVFLRLQIFPLFYHKRLINFPNTNVALHLWAIFLSGLRLKSAIIERHLIHTELMRFFPLLRRPVRILRQSFLLELVTTVTVVIVWLKSVDKDFKASLLLLVCDWVSSSIQSLDKLRRAVYHLCIPPFLHAHERSGLSHTALSC